MPTPVAVAVRVLRALGVFRREVAVEQAEPAPRRPVADRPGKHGALLTGELGLQRRLGVDLDQVDGTTCGSAVLLALASRFDPSRAAALTDGLDELDPKHAAATFEQRLNDMQVRVHRQSTRCWPRALGTSPWGMVGWLRRQVPAAGPYRVRWVDDDDGRDLATLVAQVRAALDAEHPVPLLVGAAVPRHYVLALVRERGRWQVYEPSSGEIRALAEDDVRAGWVRPVVGHPHLQAALLPDRRAARGT